MDSKSLHNIAPCPFCGSDKTSIILEQPTAMAGSIVTYAFGKCANCGACGTKFPDWGNENTYKQQAADAWNKRHI